jgi:hypothetical protein
LFLFGDLKQERQGWEFQNSKRLITAVQGLWWAIEPIEVAAAFGEWDHCCETRIIADSEHIELSQLMLWHPDWSSINQEIVHFSETLCTCCDTPA